MSFKRLFWGIGFVTLGILFLLSLFIPGILNTGTLYKLWPLILIVIGSAYLIKHEKARLAVAGFGGLLFGVIVFSLVHRPFACIDGCGHWHKKDHGERVESFSSKFNPKIKEMNITINGGAGSFIIRSDSAKEISVYQPVNGIKFTVDSLVDDSVANYSFDMKKVNITLGDNEDHYQGLFMDLNPTPSYAFDVKIGAASGEFDLSKFRLRDCDFEIGAASMSIKLGQPAEEHSDISIDAGASSISLSVPKDVAVQVECDMALSSHDFPGLKKDGEDTYRSANFDDAKKKFFISVKGGVSSLDFSQY